MKKVFFILLFVPSLSSGQITQANLAQADAAFRQMQDTITAYRAFRAEVAPLIQNGNVYECSFSTNTVALTAQQQQDIVNYYNSLKSQIVNEYNQLP